MKTAYLYVRVSTDEQKRKGYSLPEQEDRLLKYCVFNNIKVKGIYREDYSAKSFNRPEWKKLVDKIKRNSSNEVNNILFIKWDRFSRNIALAYEMIGLLKKHYTTPAAIDQPIDFAIPESTVMLAVYLAVPEAENARKSLNTTNGIRRAKQMGRYPNKAPLGYLNLTAPDGKKYIGINPLEANLIKWSFQQLAKNAYRIEQVRRMVNAKGLIVSKSRFWVLVRNPVYCGYVSFLSKETNERQLIRGVHQPIISETLFYEVQNIINTNRKIISKAYELNDMFILRKYLICPACSRKLTGSYSKGKTKRYQYYHCITGCKTRFHANIVNNDYESKLDQFTLLPGASKLFNLILEDVNINTQRSEQLDEQRKLLKQLEEQDHLISKARKLFTLGKLQFDDFSNLKKEYRVASRDLNDELNKVIMKLNLLNKQFQVNSFDNIFSEFKTLHVNDKKHIVELLSPNNIDSYGNISLQINGALSQILSIKKIKNQSSLITHAITNFSSSKF